MLYMCGLGCSLYSMAFRGTVLAFDVYGFKLQSINSIWSLYTGAEQSMTNYCVQVRLASAQLSDLLLGAVLQLLYCG